jgi:hypothetical protein
MRSRARRAAGLVAIVGGATALYTALVPFVLRPWFLAADQLPHVPGPAGVMTDADLYLNVWILAWLAHAFVHAPASLFDGNIYYPAGGTIVGSENMIAHLPWTALVLSWTGNALLTLKAYLLECFAFAGLGMFLFVRHHTRNTAAALVAGGLFTFTAFRVQTIPQPQYLGIGFFPLALLLVDLWVERRRPWHLVALAVAVALQALSCVYIGFFTFVTVPVYALARILGSRAPRPLAAGAAVAAALAAAGLVLAPLALPYARARATGVIPEHGVEWIRYFSWSPADYVSNAFVERAGALAIALVLLDVAIRRIAPLRRWAPTSALGPPWGAERALWAVAAIAAFLSAGPVIGLFGLEIRSPYQLLYDFVPGFSSLRSPLRFALIVAAALAALAGFAFARWTAGISAPRRVALAIGLTCAAAFLAAPRPVPVMAAGLGEAAPPAYAWLARHRSPGAIVEIPAAAIEDDIVGNHRNGRYMVASTIHWRPLVNGYTAYPPPLSSLLAAAIRELPSEEALATLVDLSDLRWVLVHRDLLTGREASRWPAGAAIPGLLHVGRFGPTDVYEVQIAPTRGWRDQVAAREKAPATDTLEGTPIAPLPPECRTGRILSVELPERLRPIPLPLRIPIRIENPTSCKWPALGVRPEGLVGLTYRWTSPSGAVGRTERISRLLHDVPPGGVVEAAMMVTPPSGELGPWKIEVSLVQDGVGEPLATATRTALLNEPRGGAAPNAAAPAS